MKQKQKNIHKKKMIIVILLAIAIVSTGTGGTIYALRSNSTNSQFVTETHDNKAVDSMFSFNDPQGWWQGVTTEKSTVIFDDNKTHACFVMFEYKSGMVDADAEISKINAPLAKDSENYTITSLGSKVLQLRTVSGSLQYELQQSSVTTSPGSSKVKGGQAFGYIQLSNGYVEIKGYCDTPEQLSNILVALEAIKFDDTK